MTIGDEPTGLIVELVLNHTFEIRRYPGFPLSPIHMTRRSA